MKILSGIVAATLTSVAVLASANAADLYGPGGYKDAYVAGYNWTGIYIGGGVGGGWAQNDGGFTPPPGTWSSELSTGIASGFIGAQYQWNQVVIGVEGNVAGLFESNLGSALCQPLSYCPGTPLDARLNDPIWSAGGRLGWAAGTWMPYVTGGWADTRVNNRLFSAPNTLAEQSTADDDGWYIGGGIDYAILPHVILGVEYRHYDFGPQSAVPTCAEVIGTCKSVGAPDPADTWKNETTVDTVQARVSYKFGVWGPEPLK